MVYHALLILPEIDLALKRSNIKPKLSLGILRTCRQIYYEASAELYRRDIFGTLRGYHRESLSAVIPLNLMASVVLLLAALKGLDFWRTCVRMSMV